MSRIYSATYSNVPVYEFNVQGNHVMRRRSDDWINATHILKVADFDKPARTRILEREVQKGVHEKVQGGYGKYQGTWIPLHDGRALAERNGVLEKLAAIFDFVPGDRSPPPAPKHATAASSKPKAPRQAPAPKRQPVAQRMSELSNDNYSVQIDEEGTPDNLTLMSESEDDGLYASQQSMGSRKRKRGIDVQPTITFQEQQHMLWSDELLDYFMLQNCSEPLPPAPMPHPTVDVNRQIDDKGHTPMHWAAAMGDINIVQDLMRRGASIKPLSSNGETPLMRAVMFTNNWDRQTMSKLISLLHPTIGQKDWFSSTVFHQIAMSTCSKAKYQCARYYLDAILDKLVEVYAPSQISQLLDLQDNNGDTAVMLAARYGARKCVRSLLARGVSTTIPNSKGEIADELIKELNARRRDRYRPGSSSPVQQPNGLPSSLHTRSASGTTQPPSKVPRYASEAAALLTSQLPSLIASRAEALASALEAEITEREMGAQEAERLLEQRKLEISALEQESRLLISKDEDPAFDAQQQHELDVLTRECETLLSTTQTAERLRVLEKEIAFSKSPSMRRKTEEDDDNDADNPARKLELAQHLVNLQIQRTKLISDVVAAQSLAQGDSGQRHHLYKRLITGALGVKAEDVEALLPDMLAELEEDVKGAVVGTGGAPVLANNRLNNLNGDTADISGLDVGIGVDGLGALARNVSVSGNAAGHTHTHSHAHTGHGLYAAADTVHVLG